jgi:hypothetical protein
MLAILEASPEHAEHFLPKTCTRLHMLALLGVGLRAGLAAVAGVLFIKVIKLAWR